MQLSDATGATDFNPARYLTKISGADYLEVRYRLLWLRERHPDAEIETELISHQGEAAVFRAKASIPGGGSATGWARESKQTFPDYVEKCETSAIGRALAALGYGTQFCPDHDFGASQGRVVDAPVQRTRQTTPQNGGPLTERVRNDRESAPAQEAAPATKPAATPGNPPTERQWAYLERLRGDLNLERPEMAEFFTIRYGYHIDNADRADLSNLIDAMKGVIDGAHTLESIMVRVAPLETASAPVAAVTGNAGGVPWDDLPPVEPPF